jgi:hypothetical protein
VAHSLPLKNTEDTIHWMSSQDSREPSSLRRRRRGRHNDDDLASENSARHVRQRLYSPTPVRRRVAADDDNGIVTAAVAVVNDMETSSAEDSGTDYDYDCVICLEGMNEANALRLRCSHYLHPDCARSWFRRRRTCPVCRCVASDEEPDLKEDFFDLADFIELVSEILSHSSPSPVARRNPPPRRSTRQAVIANLYRMFIDPVPPTSQPEQRQRWFSAHSVKSAFALTQIYEWTYLFQTNPSWFVRGCSTFLASWWAIMLICDVVMLVQDWMRRNRSQ